MKQVSYEEAIKSLEITRQHAVYGEALDQEHNSSFIRNINKVEKFLEQHKPPTFDEVVSYWKSIGYGVSVNYDNRTQITSVMQQGSGKLKHISFDWLTDFIDWGQYVHSFSKEEWCAINLTLRYLEAQEETNE